MAPEWGWGGTRRGKAEQGSETEAETGTERLRERGRDREGGPKVESERNQVMRQRLRGSKRQ